MGISTYQDPYAPPVIQAAESVRSAYLRKLGLLTFASLAITALAAVVMMAALLQVDFLLNRWVSLGIMLGGIYGAQFIGSSLVVSDNQGTRLAGFIGGSALSGVAISYVILSAVLLSASLYDNPLVIVGQAGGLVFLTVLGMVGYLLTGPKNLSMLGSVLSMLTLPMLALMAITFIFPVGGIAGIAISALFVAISAGGLFYSLNGVLHKMSPNMVMAGAFTVSIGIVVLFWNILTLLMRLQRR